MKSSIVFAASVFSLSAPLAAQAPVPIIQPGAPGAPARVLTPEQAAKVANTRFIGADLEFMSGMIHHHQQALDMAKLAPARSTNKDLLTMAARIAASQKDEMKFMRDWLSGRGAAPTAPMPAMTGHDHGGLAMKGMATPAQMAQLAASKGEAFDRLFLQLMTAHHAGAVTMVEELLERPGAAYDPVLFQFTSDVKNEQTAEIKRMDALKARLSADPREALKAGFRDAGQATSNMKLVASLPKPAGFFDPANPAGYPPMKVKKGVKPTANAFRDDGQTNDDTEWSDRSPLLSFAQTDMAFAGDRLFVGNYHGFNTYRLGANACPCRSGQ